MVVLCCGWSSQTPQPGRTRGHALDRKSGLPSLLLGIPDYQSFEYLGSKGKTAVLLSSRTSVLYGERWGITTNAADIALREGLQPHAANTCLPQLLPITQPHTCSRLIIILISLRRGNIVFSSVLKKIKAHGNLVHPGQQCFAASASLCAVTGIDTIKGELLLNSFWDLSMLLPESKVSWWRQESLLPLSRLESSFTPSCLVCFLPLWNPILT